MGHEALYCTQCHTVAEPVVEVDEESARKAKSVWVTLGVIGGLVLAALLFIGLMGTLPKLLSSGGGDDSLSHTLDGCTGGCLGGCGGCLGVLFIGAMLVTGAIFPIRTNAL